MPMCYGKLRVSICESRAVACCCFYVSGRVRLYLLAVQSGSDVSGDGLGRFTVNVDSDSCITLVQRDAFVVDILERVTAG